jgi:hypothetical protein
LSSSIWPSALANCKEQKVGKDLYLNCSTSQTPSTIWQSFLWTSPVQAIFVSEKNLVPPLTPIDLKQECTFKKKQYNRYPFSIKL